MDTTQLMPDETKALRRCVRELAALSTLSAAWGGNDVPEIAEGLCRVLCRSLPAAFTYVRVNDHYGTAAVEIAGTLRGPISPNQTEEIGKSLEPLLKPGSPDSVPTIANPFGSGTLRLAVIPLGYEGDCGVLVAASQQPDFPSQTDRLLLGVAANQAAIVLQQKRSEEQVRRSERRFREMIDSLPAAIYTTDAEGRLTHLNPAAVELSGRAPDEMGTDSWCVSWKLYYPDGKPMPHDQCPMAVAVRENRAVRGAEIIIERPDGSRVWSEAYPTPLRDAEGRVIGGINMLLDISERKRTEEAKAKLAAIVESSDDAIVSKNLNGIITSWNRGAERIFGYTAQETLGQPITMLMPPDRVDEEPGILERIRRGEKIEHYETIRRRKDGTLLTIALSVSPVFDAQGNIIGASKIARDITRRKQAEQRQRLLWEVAVVLLSADDPDPMLRSLLAKIGPHLGVDVYFNYIVNDSGDALRLASCDGIPVEAARKITRLEFGQAICGTVALPRRPIVASHIQQSDAPEVLLLKSFGIRAYACNPLVAGERLLGTLSFGSRIKDQFDPEEVTFLETLCRYITVAYERLRLLNELKETDRRKDEFLATLAHELRNPLAPVRNAVQVLRLKGPDLPELRWGRDVIDRQIEHLTRLIDDLLDVSRITRNKLELRKQRVELSEVARGAVESSRPIIEECGHELTVRLPTQPIYLNGDLVRLSQVFLKLLNNAAKYTERGGRIWLTAEQQGSEAVVRVEDTGVGIPAEKLPRLFDIFFQVDRTLERSQGGLGIGLSLVRRLVELHGGTVEARSEGVGKGSEFIVRLPALVEKPKPSSSQESNRGGVAKATPARRILLVDDNRDSADSLAMLLRLTGNEVHTAYDGVEGVEAAGRLRPEVVLLDIGMPRLNGEDACRRIRNEPWGTDMVLIALTGWGQEEDRRRTVEAGFDAHMVKPVDPEALLKLLAERQPKPA